MTRQLDDHWDLRLGEVSLIDVHGKKYVLVVGYSNFDKKLYFRLYDDKSGNLLRGTWLTTLYEDFADLFGIPTDIIEDIKTQAKRLESLKALA